MFAPMKQISGEYSFDKKHFNFQSIKAFELLIRPDINEQSIGALLTSVLLALGGSITDSKSEYDSIHFKGIIPVDQTLSASIDIQLGANKDKLRALLFYATTSSGTTNTSNMQTVAKFSLRVAGQIEEAIHSEGFSLSSSHNLFARTLTSTHFDDTMAEIRWNVADILSIIEPSIEPKLAQMNKEQLSFVTERWSRFVCAYRVASLLDPKFVRDLQAQYAGELEETLRENYIRFDAAIRAEETNCARLMTMLKHAYQRCGIPLPSPPKTQRPAYTSSKSNKSETDRGSIADIDIQQCKLLLLRTNRLVEEELSTLARGKSSDQEITDTSLRLRHLLAATNIFGSMGVATIENVPYFDTLSFSRSQLLAQHLLLLSVDASSNDSSATVSRSLSASSCELLLYFHRIDRALYHINEHFRTWQQEELTFRLAPQKQLSNQRIQEIADFKRLLVQNLTDRDMTRCSVADQLAFSGLREKCKVITEINPLVIELPATWIQDVNSTQSQTTSTLSLVSSLQSYASGLLNRAGTMYLTKLHVVFYSAPLFAAPVLKVIAIHDILECSPVKLPGFPVISSSDLTPNNVLAIKETDGQVTYFQIAGPTPDYCQRLSDLLDIQRTLLIPLSVSSSDIIAGSIADSINESTNVPFNDVTASLDATSNAKDVEIIPQLSSSSTVSTTILQAVSDQAVKVSSTDNLLEDFLSEPANVSVTDAFLATFTSAVDVSTPTAISVAPSNDTTPSDDNKNKDSDVTVPAQASNTSPVVASPVNPKPLAKNIQVCKLNTVVLNIFTFTDIFIPRIFFLNAGVSSKIAV